MASNILQLYNFVTEKLMPEFGDGVWICSTDMLIEYANSAKLIKSIARPDACIITVGATPEYASYHGTVLTNEDGSVKDILYAAQTARLSHYAVDGSVKLISGIVYVSHEIAERLLSLQAAPPLECCTYMGFDVGAHPHPVSLYFDIILAMCKDISEGDFMHRSSSITRMDAREGGDADRDTAFKVRRLIWDNMRRFSLYSAHVDDSAHHYFSVGLCLQEHLKTIYLNSKSKAVHTVISSSRENKLDEAKEEIYAINTCFSNSRLYEGPVYAFNSFIDDGLILQPNTCVQNIDTRQSGNAISNNLTLKSGLCLQEIQMILQSQTNTNIRVPVVYGISDVLMEPFRPEGKYCGLKWDEFFKATQLTELDLWPAKNTRKSIWTAKLFPVLTSAGEPKLDGLFWAFDNLTNNQLDPEKWRFSWRYSLEEIFLRLDTAAEFALKRFLFYDILVEKLMTVLNQGQDFYFVPYFNSAVVDGFAEKILNALDMVAAGSSHGVAARTLNLIGDMISSMAQGHGGLRSGPAANEAFQHAFQAFENGHIQSGVYLMAKERKSWLSRPDLMIRCARHYEGASQILCRKAVAAAKQFIKLDSQELPLKSPYTTWFIAECGARIDLSGGWTDTPPIAYEKGGVVVNAALLINGKRPIGAKARRTQRFSIVLINEFADSLGGNELTQLADLKDYCIPSAPGALLKACILFAELVDMYSQQSLEDQLRSKWGCGFEIATWSNLPQGSGLGTSSILAAAIISALWSVAEKKFDNSAVIHAVLCVEQMLTTGGGWQDQVGGVYGGFKVGSSPAALPLHVSVQPIPIGANIVDELNSRIVLIYTGKPRLAKNLLQNVVRNWYARQPHVVRTCTALVDNAKECMDSLTMWNFEKFCSCIVNYYEQKKLMAAGTEPASVGKIIDAMKPYICSHTLAGAGGGGFLFCLLKNSSDREKIAALIGNIKGAEAAAIYSASIDEEGIKIFTAEEDSAAK
ncbi:L-fucose kinase-like isoform X2 [Paramacrobiotus metropolitanus]|nr:L-fucose kinase-like isoform X2 [Paramacrobiotus metropolitanus]